MCISWFFIPSGRKMGKGFFISDPPVIKFIGNSVYRFQAKWQLKAAAVFFE